MQLLFFLEILLIFYVVTAPCYVIPRIYIFVKNYKVNKDFVELLQLVLGSVSIIAFAIFAVMFGLFVHFHYKLVINNSTTIENLDKEHAEENKKFCLSEQENWEQVFGENRKFWYLPIVCEQGAPKGDGLAWPTNNVEMNNVNYAKRQNLNY